MKKIIFLSIITTSIFANASDFQSIKTVQEAVKLAESVSITDPNAKEKNIAERMKNLNMNITGGTKFSFDTKAELEQPTDKIGDFHFSIHSSGLSEQFKKTVCDMAGDPEFLRRNGKFYPENRTANFLMTGNCSTNFPRPK